MARQEYEKRVITIMTGMYCRHYHGSVPGKLCDTCTALLEYAISRINRCPLGDAKTSCRKCKIHCYAPERRESIRAVMRYAGPRMTIRHPAIAIQHLIYEIK